MPMSKHKDILPLYDAFAVPADYAGPLADDFHRMVAGKYLGGMINGHTSVVRGATAEGLVREHLAIDWEISHGCAPRHRHFMPEIKWHDFRPTVLSDRWRSLIASILSVYHRCFNPNPYR